MMMNAIAFANHCGLTYVHTPFASIAHADRPMRDWVEAWEAEFNLGLGEVVTDGDNRQTVNYAYNFSDLLPLFGLDQDDLTDALSKTIPELRRKYYSGKVARKNAIAKIGVHVRRGDVTPDRSPGMWTSGSIVARTLAEVRAILETRGIAYQVGVFSQGRHEDFSALEGPDTQFFLDADPIWTMRELIEADIFIMAKSSFSYVAALISDGVKLAPSDSYPPLRDWVVVGPQGKFDQKAFDLQLGTLAWAPDASLET
jgi:hypothetical protein